jgi:hypothetical protein
VITMMTMANKKINYRQKNQIPLNWMYIYH